MGWLNDIFSFGPDQDETNTPKSIRNSVENNAARLAKEGEFGPAAPIRSTVLPNAMAEQIKPKTIPSIPSVEGVLSESQKDEIRTLLDERRELLQRANQSQSEINSLVNSAENEGYFGTTIERAINDRLVGRDRILSRVEEVDTLISLIQSNASNTKLRFSSAGTINDIGQNVLNDYMDVQYHISLTMLGEKVAREIQRTGLSANEITLKILRSGAMASEDGTFRRSSGSVTLASTGANFRKPENDLRASVDEQLGAFGEFGTNSEDELGRRDYNYYHIISMGLENVYAPSQQNPLLSTFTSLKMKIAEPAGFKLHEDIRNIARSLGYININPGRIVYRIDVYFSGYDPRTGNWTNKIPLGDEDAPDIISYYVALADVQAKVESHGTTYEADFVPFGHFAYRPEEASLQANSLFTSEINTFGGFLNRLESLMNEAKSRRTSGILKRKYQFFCPDFLRNASFNAKQYGVDKQYILENQREGNILAIGDDLDLMTLLRGAMANVPTVQQLFLNNDDPSFSEPRIHFGVRFNTIYGDENGTPQVNTDLNDYDVLTYQYIIEPFVTFKKGTVTPANIGEYMARQSQLERIRQIVRFGMLSRIYNYIYTSENTEVIDFDINLKSFYYTTLNTIYDNAQIAGLTNSDSASVLRQTRQESNALTDPRGPLVEFTQTEPTDEGSVLQRLFGTSDPNEIETGEGMTPQERLGGGFGEFGDSDYYTGSSQSGSPLRNAYSNYIDDHLKNDLLTLDGMKIRGDPIWLFSPYANASLDTIRIPGNERDSSKPSSLIRIYPRTGKLIFLKMLAPVQDDLGNQNRAGASSYPTIIGGFYEVTTIKSMFENGQFTQELDGVKLNHLNYVEDVFGSQVTASARLARDVFFPSQTGLSTDPIPDEEEVQREPRTRLERRQARQER